MIDSVATLDLKRVSRLFPSPGGDVTALQSVDFLLQPGEFVAISGPSGSGKTTLLHLAALLDRPTGGELLFRGNSVMQMTEDQVGELRKFHIGMVFQAFHLMPRRTVLENVRFRFRYQAISPGEEEQRAREALSWVGMDHLAAREVRWLSGGEMQRVAIARAVAGRPSLLLADEPTGNLDHANSMAVMNCFEQLHSAGITILMVTHNEGLLSFASRHLHCRDGRLEDVT
ncbi:MAG TPA: ABC transporter ATP-binding protein [Kiritimatiellia bacterium]|nr:ABC transporter ATP-binding protein [Kiritimatiellia bacterium]